MTAKPARRHGIPHTPPTPSSTRLAHEIPRRQRKDDGRTPASSTRITNALWALPYCFRRKNICVMDTLLAALRPSPNHSGYLQAELRIDESLGASSSVIKHYCT